MLARHVAQRIGQHVNRFEHSGKNRIRVILVALMILGESIPISAQVQSFTSFINDLVDLESLPRLDSAPVRMASTYDRTGGDDDGFNPAWLKDGVYTFLDLQGPGVIRRFYSAKPGGRLRIFIDGNPNPTVDMPCEEFFAGRANLSCGPS